MKKTAIAVLLMGFSSYALAQQAGFISPAPQNITQGGFTGPTPGLSTVAQAKTLRDDAWVVLEGHIVQQIGHELYEFRDNSGSVYVDIDYKYWHGQSVSPGDKVHIEGELDKDWNSVEIDVKNLRIVK